jgi:5-methylcytosine-specific restriction endonuclease McrBC GTP-binding regulatory subunit McrB
MGQLDAATLSESIEAIADLSAPTSSKWNSFYDVASALFGITINQTYVTYINQAANTQVRINKQMPNDREVKVAFGVCGSPDWDSKSYEKQAIRSIKDRKSLNCVIFMWRQSEEAESQWQARKCFCRMGSAEGDLAKSLWPGIEIVEVETGKNQSPKSHSNPGQGDFAEQVIRLLQWNKNVVLEGVPGTGKSFAINGVVAAWKSVTGRPISEVTVVVLHPSTAYEDLVEGLRPDVDMPEGDFLEYPIESTVDSSFKPRLGRLAEAALRAASMPDSDHLVVLDELNRANVPRALGELMLVMESTKRAKRVNDEWVPATDGLVRLTYSGVKFWLPDNLYILATMNTSDRSVAPLDTALRRRFVFKRLEPMSSLDLSSNLAQLDGDAKDVFANLTTLWETVNDSLLRLLIGPDAVLGHSYLFGLHEALVRSTSGSERETGAAFLRYIYLPQLIDVVTANGREVEVFGSEIDLLTEDQSEAMDYLKVTLLEFGLQVHLQGEGLSRRIVIDFAPADEPVIFAAQNAIQLDTA